MSQLHATFDAIFKPFGIHPESIEMQRYRNLLRTHDWLYEFSDDGAVYRKGYAQRQQLRVMQPIHDPDFKIWDANAPAGSR